MLLSWNPELKVLNMRRRVSSENKRGDFRMRLIFIREMAMVVLGF